MTLERILLSPPDVSEADRDALNRAFDGGWIAPLGPEVDAFEAELADVSGQPHVAALSAGTAALHLALIVAGVGANDRVFVSDLTFAASVNAIRYVGAVPVFIDSERSSWNMDPDLLDEALQKAAAEGTLPAAVIAVDLYGQCADYERIVASCRNHDVLLIEDAAEALGSTYRGKPAGSFADLAVLSFNGNKIITTSGGGALATSRPEWRDQAVFLATQARDPAPHYQHSSVGYNYRMSNLLAALGRSQLADLPRRVEARRRINRTYREQLGAIPGVEFMPEIPEGVTNFWLTTLTFDQSQTGVTREQVRQHLESENIEARPVWKPMHLQPVFEGCEVVGGSVSSDLFDRGLCLPSGSTLTDDDLTRVVEAVHAVHGVSG